MATNRDANYESENERIPPLEIAISLLELSDADVLSYASARRTGFSVVRRRLLFDGNEFTSFLTLRLGAVAKEIHSSSAAFHHCAFSHLFTSIGFLLKQEIETDSSSESLLRVGVGKLSLNIRYGLMALTESDLHYFELDEDRTTKAGGREFQFWLSHEAAVPIGAIPGEPKLELIVNLDETIANSVHGFVNSISPFQSDETRLVSISGVDGLYGSRALISARFNAQVNPSPGITCFAAFIDLAALSPTKPIEVTPVPGLDRFLNSPGCGARQFCEFLKGLRDELPSDQAIANMSRYFERVLRDSPQQMSALTALAFLNSLTLLKNRSPIYIAIGSVKGVHAKSVSAIAPGVVIVPPNQLPFGIVGENVNQLLCEHWDRDASALLAFFQATSVMETTEHGWQVLRDAFDDLQVAIADAAWLHVDNLNSQHVYAVDCRAQDAILELDHWYHVHDLFGGVAHQYYAKREKSSNKLTMDNRMTNVLAKRMTLASYRRGPTAVKFPKLASHISNAVQWLSRARSSFTLSERFLCTWIAAEYLAVSRDESARGSDIKSQLSSRLASLLGHSGRTSRRYWESAMDDCYDLRCALVHEAKEDTAALTKNCPLLMQAVVETIIFALLSVANLTDDVTPSEMLDSFRFRNRPTQ